MPAQQNLDGVLLAPSYNCGTTFPPSGLDGTGLGEDSGLDGGWGTGDSGGLGGEGEGLGEGDAPGQDWSCKLDRLA